jgi:hypothetical protein
MAEVNGKGDISSEQMKQLNSSPVMKVKEYLDYSESEEGKTVSKEVEVFPRNASSIEFCVDSKGAVKPKVKVYHESPDVAFEMAVELMNKALVESNKMADKL